MTYPLHPQLARELASRMVAVFERGALASEMVGRPSDAQEARRALHCLRVPGIVPLVEAFAFVESGALDTCRGRLEELAAQRAVLADERRKIAKRKDGDTTQHDELLRSLDEEAGATQELIERAQTALDAVRGVVEMIAVAGGLE